MSLPTAREVFEKNKGFAFFSTYEYDHKILRAKPEYVCFLEQQNEKMLDALIYEHAATCETCKHDCTGRDEGCYQQKKMKEAIESATGLPIDEAIKRWEEGK